MPNWRKFKPWTLFAAILALACGGQAPATAGAPLLPGGYLPPTFVPPGCVATTQIFQHFGSEPINDQSTITSTLAVSGLPVDTWQVTAYTQISHTFSSDLNVHLIGPNEFGARNTLTTGNGGSNDNVFAYTIWSDLAPVGVTELTFANNQSLGFAIPEGAMGQHFRHNANGIWKLVVQDAVPQDSGQLNGWALAISTLPFAPIGASQFPNKVVNQAIPNGGTLTSTIVIANAGTVLDDVYVNMVVPHNHSGELTMTLMAPTGVTTTLTSGNGGSLANLYDSVEFTDGPVGNYAGPVTDAAYVDGDNLGQVQPEGAMHHFAGINPNGSWRLIITDAGGLGTGSLQSWQLGIYTSHCEAVYLPTVRR